MKVFIIVPAYNEEKRIGKTLFAYEKYFNELVKDEKLDYELLVAINNTTDRTEEIVKGFSRKNKRIRYLNLVRGGKGFAVIEGFKEALRRNNELIGFVDADLATKPDSFYDLIHKIGSYDGAIASRYISGAVINPAPTVQRLIAKRMFNILVRILLSLPYHDTQCGAKIFKRAVIEKTLPSLTMSQWAFDVDMLYAMKKNGFKIKEIPTIWSDKEYAKINFWKAGPEMALGVIRLRVLHSPFRRLIKIYENLMRMKQRKV